MSSTVNQLERYHKFLPISASGKTLLGKSFSKVVAEAISPFGKGSFIFKIGNRVVGSFQWATSS